MNVQEMLSSLYLADLDIKLPGFRKFVSSWIYLRNECCFVVDPGPSSTILSLIQALHELGVKKLDYILLTHIHIDHAGGTGLLLKEFPDTKVNCHPAGVQHLISPEKLWQGSLKVLGDMAEAYGPIMPVPEKDLNYQSVIHFNDSLIKVFETPGHAAHHLSYQFNDLLFAGEAAGINIPAAGGRYQRIATPPRFIYEVYKDSLLKASNIPAKYIAFAHYGLRNDADNVITTALQQLDFWMKTVEKHYLMGNVYNEQDLLIELLETDPALKMFSKLDSDLQEREKSFCLNSIRGMYDFIKKKAV